MGLVRGLRVVLQALAWNLPDFGRYKLQHPVLFRLLGSCFRLFWRRVLIPVARHAAGRVVGAIPKESWVDIAVFQPISMDSTEQMCRFRDVFFLPVILVRSVGQIPNLPYLAKATDPVCSRSPLTYHSS